MRIAVCLSGQPRTWDKCYQRWMEILAGQGEVDFFFHLWDYNTLPQLLKTVNGRREFDDEPLSIEEQEKLVTTIQPKKYMFESRKPIKYWNCTHPESEQIGGWTREQFYSLYRVSLLKREYEIENNFRYDLVIRIRTDVWFDHPHTFIRPEPNTLYSGHNAWDKRFQVYRIGDVFFYADSHTFDQAALFFKFLSFIPRKWVIGNNDCPPPEVAMFYFLANLGIINFPTHTSLRVFRDPRVKEIKGYLDEYEIS